jgi:CO/xanthine dehydrogenase Mo-binding subunit
MGNAPKEIREVGIDDPSSSRCQILGTPSVSRGVGEVPIVPPMAAVANAIHAATGIRLRDLPMSPPKILAEIDAEEPRRLAAE